MTDQVPMPAVPASADLLLAIRTLGDQLDDLEHIRIQAVNRLAALERERGGTLPAQEFVVHELDRLEDATELELIRMWRKHRLAPWAKACRGLGEKSIARLVAAIGEPAERPNVAKLWAYCGVGDPLRKRRKGMSQDEARQLGNPRARKQCWLIATSMLKDGCGAHQLRSKQRKAAGETGWLAPPSDCTCMAERRGRIGYDHRRLATAGREGWTDARKHNDALRIVAKEFLKELWRAARDPDPARANLRPTPVRDAPARANLQSTPIRRAPAPARAKGASA